MIRSLKKKIQQELGPRLSSLHKGIVVNSYGRSGSTLLYKAFLKSAADRSGVLGRMFVEKGVGRSAWDLNKTEIKRGHVYKTHDYPPLEPLGDDCVLIYIFSDPVEVVLSLLRLQSELGDEWMREHFHHLGVEYDPPIDLVNRDELRLERHFDAWLSEDRFPVVAVNFKYMWDYQDKFAEHIGVPVQLPPKRKRTQYPHGTSELRELLKQTYATLIRKTEETEPFRCNF